MAKHEFLFGFANREFDLKNDRPIQKSRSYKKIFLAVAAFLSLGAYSFFMLYLLDASRFNNALGAVIQTQQNAGAIDLKVLGVSTVLLLVALLLTRALVTELALDANI
jgi:hypothetical protein